MPEIFKRLFNVYNYGSVDLVRHWEEKEFITSLFRFVHKRNYERLLEEFNSLFIILNVMQKSKNFIMDLIMKTNELINLQA